MSATLFCCLLFNNTQNIICVSRGGIYILCIHVYIHLYDDPAFLGRLLGLSAVEELISSIVCLFGLDSLLVGDFLIRFLVGGGGIEGVSPLLPQGLDLGYKTNEKWKCWKQSQARGT